MTGSPQVLISDWCQQFPSHSIGDLNFGPDGDLYVSGGDGASFNFADYGQSGGSAARRRRRTRAATRRPVSAGPQTAPDRRGRRAARRRASAGRPASRCVLNGASSGSTRTPAPRCRGQPEQRLSRRQRDADRRLRVPQPVPLHVPPGHERALGRRRRLGHLGGDRPRRVADERSVAELRLALLRGRRPAAGLPEREPEPLHRALRGRDRRRRPTTRTTTATPSSPGDSCPTANGSSITGDRLLHRRRLPGRLQRRALLRRLHPQLHLGDARRAATACPTRRKIQLLDGGAANPVDLEAGPGGDLFYADIEGGTIQRISYSAPGSGTTCAAGQFEAKYFNNMTLTGTPVVDQCEAAVNHDWGTGSPAPGVNADGFSASWDGSFAFAAGTYTFSATGDDGIRVYVDGTKVIDGWKDQSATTYTAPLTLTAGTHAVRVEYYDDTVDAVAEVSWQANSTGGGGGGTCSGQFEAKYFNNMTLDRDAGRRSVRSGDQRRLGRGQPCSRRQRRWVLRIVGRLVHVHRRHVHVLRDGR